MTLRRGLGLLGAGLLSEVVYLTITARLPWWRYGAWLTSWSQVLGRSWGVFALCLVGIGLLLAAYLWGWRVVQRGLASRRAVWAGAVVFALTLFWLLPITADLFLYLTKAHLLTDYGVNPLHAAPVSVGHDALLAAYDISYEELPSAYGPAWVLLSAVGTLGPYDRIVGTLYLKGLAAASYLACAWLLERILQHLRPASALEGLYLFAWNPLVLLMAVGGGHNDIVMMALVLLAGWLLLREQWALAFGAMTLSVWIKYVSVILFPLCLIYAWRQTASQKNGHSRLLVQGGVAALGVSALVLGPFWYPNLFADMVGRLLSPANALSALSTLSHEALLAGLVLFVLIYGAVLVRMGGRFDSISSLIEAGFGLSLLAFILGAARSQPWHLIWATSLAGLAGKRWAWLVVIALGGLLLAGQVWIEWGMPGWHLFEGG
jgi:alpha-1,6-mannosyltransferase